MPAGCLYAPQAFIDRNPATVQAIANAIVRADKWIQAAGPADIIKAVPENYLLGDRAVYIDAFLASKGALSVDGMIPPDGAATALRALQSVDESLKGFKFDLVRRVDERLRQAREREDQGMSVPALVFDGVSCTFVSARRRRLALHRRARRHAHRRGR